MKNFNLGSLFIFGLVAELFVVPTLVFMDLGLSIPIPSSFFARFGYLLIYLACVAVFFLNLKKFYFPFISKLYVFSFVIAAAIGLAQNSLSSAMVSHVFYFTMPVLAVNFGWIIMEKIQTDAYFRRKFLKINLYGFYVGAALCLMFFAAGRLGLSEYDGYGIWNMILTTPFVIAMHPPFFVAILSGFAVLVAGKRSVLVAFAFMMLMHFLKNGSRLSGILTIAFFCGSLALAISYIDLSRLFDTIELVMTLSLDKASSGRVAEAQSALEEIGNRPMGWYFGAGLGGRFLPWSNLEDYENYWSHYAHFSPISYIWIGGLVMALGVYLYLLGLLARLFVRYGKLNDLIGKPFLMLMAGIIMMSVFGAVLMNDPILWIYVGASVRLLRGIHVESRKSVPAKSRPAFA